ncbi:MAG TPA: hypothetical protein VE398_15380 [Acidobacteriota bacterium]|nr:hypothetical protein [Acidobacteriota bacterium]
MPPTALVLLRSVQPTLLAAPQRTSSLEPVEITVRIYNYANIESYTLEPAQRRAAAILRQAGFEIRWLHCARRAEERSQYPACISKPGANDVILKIMPRIDMKEIGFGKNAFGLCAGQNISISVERLEEIAQDSDQTCGRILGLAVAHEIGHVLLGSNSHSSQGIMRPQWYIQDLQLESRYGAFFTEEQIRQMHQRLIFH